MKKRDPICVALGGYRGQIAGQSGFQADCNRKQVEGLKYGSEIMILKEYSEPHYVIWKMDIGSVRVQGRRQL